MLRKTAYSCFELQFANKNHKPFHVYISFNIPYKITKLIINHRIQQLLLWQTNNRENCDRGCPRSPNYLYFVCLVWISIGPRMKSINNARQPVALSRGTRWIKFECSSYRVGSQFCAPVRVNWQNSKQLATSLLCRILPYFEHESYGTWSFLRIQIVYR